MAKWHTGDKALCIKTSDGYVYISEATMARLGIALDAVNQADMVTVVDA